ncbi:Uncharacterized protein APZ42_017544 [Daphnia magna]|uniref:Uncharacterized protein n=1 Tax=Daphnia magna TaxID=35525 RepID=A0A164ZXQ3_9CRUS|nr:Uncharacterized protein APZ42_017544 [Daphnia magna]
MDSKMILMEQEKVVRVAEEEGIAINPVLKEAKHCDDMEPILWKQKPYVSDIKLSRHSTNPKFHT